MSSRIFSSASRSCTAANSMPQPPCRRDDARRAAPVAACSPMVMKRCLVVPPSLRLRERTSAHVRITKSMSRGSLSRKRLTSCAPSPSKRALSARRSSADMRLPRAAREVEGRKVSSVESAS